MDRGSGYRVWAHQMISFARSALLAQLTTDEGFRPYIYDDATGREVLAGTTLIGHATLAIGWCPETNPCPEDLAQYILAYFADGEIATLQRAVPWVIDLSDARQRALYDMSFQLGVTGLLKFNTFMSLLQQGQFEQAADDLATTAWFKQAPARAARIQALIKNG